MMAATLRPKSHLAAPAALLLSLVAVLASNVWIVRTSDDFTCRNPGTVPVRSVAIVPGASVWNDRPLPTLKGRLETALTLYREGRAKAILISGNDTPADPEVRVMRAWLKEHGVRELDIWADEHGSRTRDTMLNAAAAFEVRDALVCTQDLFMPRALFLARQAGIEATGIVVPMTLPRSTVMVVGEVLKTTVAFFETLV